MGHLYHSKLLNAQRVPVKNGGVSIDVRSPGRFFSWRPSAGWPGLGAGSIPLWLQHTFPENKMETRIQISGPATHRNAQSWPVGELLQLVGETLVKHWWNIWGFFSQFFFAFQGSLCGFLHHSLSRRSSLSLSLVLESRPNSSGLAGKSPIQFVDFPSYKAPFIVDFQLPCLITRG